MTGGSIDSAPAEKLLSLTDARVMGVNLMKIERIPHVIWWVMDRGYVVVPQGTRPKWFFAAEEETLSPEGD